MAKNPAITRELPPLNFSQKGAMFGLDARISLAIFGSLSVITGIAATIAIKETQVTQLVSEFDNYKKAYLEFVLNNGVDTTTISDLWIQPPTLGTTWQGPYITRESENHPTFGTYAFVSGRPDTEQTPPEACSTGNLCAIWLHLTAAHDTTLFSLDEKIDGIFSATKGMVRIEAQPGNTDDVYFRIAVCLTDSC